MHPSIRYKGEGEPVRPGHCSSTRAPAGPRRSAPTVVADVLGHEDASITLEVYAHLGDRRRTDDDVREALRRNCTH